LLQFSEKDRSVLAAVLDSTSSINVVIPEEIDSDKLWETMETCCRVAGAVSKASDRIKPIIGRLLVVLKDHPEVYQDRGYSSYEDFMCRGMNELFGISRTEAYACRKVAERFPSLSVDEFNQIGVRKLYVLAAATREGDKNAKELVEKAKDPEVNRSDLIEYAATLQHMAAGEFEITKVTITVTKETAQMWKDFIASKEVQAFAGNGTDPATDGGIFRRMLEECAGEWLVQGRYILNAGRHEAVVEHIHE
jgi:hypothetical protein